MLNEYCLEIQADGVAVMHRVDCAAYDLGTLLGLGCVANLGRFPDLKTAIDAVKAERPDAICCNACCKAQVLLLPLFRRYPLARAISSLSG